MKVTVARSASADGVRFVRMPHVKRGPVAVGVHRDRRNTHFAARTADPDGNFAAVGDQDLLHGDPSIVIRLKTNTTPV